MTDFITQLLPVLLKEKSLVASVITKGQECFALDICVVGANSLGTWNGGFQEEVAPFSPGSLLLLEGIRQCYQMGFGEFDLMRGQEAYKQRWASDDRKIGLIVLD